MTTQNKTAEELAADKVASDSAAATEARSSEIKAIVEAALTAERSAVAEATAEAAIKAKEESDAAEKIAESEAAAKLAATHIYTAEDLVEAGRAAVKAAQDAAIVDAKTAPTRKGLVNSNVGAADFSLTEDDELNVEDLAKLPVNTFRKVAGAAWALQPATESFRGF